MTRIFRFALAFVLAFALASCGDAPTVVGDGALSVSRTSASVEPGTCTNLAQLNQLAAVLFTSTSSPNISSVKGKLKNLDQLVRKNRITDAQVHASEIVAFTLKKHNQGGLAGSDADVEAFSNAVLCFAGIDIDVEEPDNSFFILPSDQPQVITNIEGNAGIAFDANPVSEPTLVEIEVIPDIFGAGDGPLDTRLDQYPGFIHITKTSETNAALTRPAVVAVCASGVIPADVRARLRLGHGATAGFEITQPAPASFITCPIQTASAPASSGWSRVAELLMPSKAHAFQQEFGGGVGGTVTEFSPFAPVDPLLEFGGGVGGTVTEFTRMGLAQSALLSETLNLVGACSTPIEGAQGSPLRDECRPSVTVRTRLGTPFIGVPVNWGVTVGGGSIAANTGACDTFGAAATTTTGPNGGAGICWTLGTVGANQVIATPTLGGDALDGVVFSPASFTFDAIANPPAGLRFSVQPPAVAATDPAFPVEVTVVDKNGERVFGSVDPVSLRISHGNIAGAGATIAGKAVAGIFRRDLSVTTPGTGFSFLATAGFVPLSASPTSNLFDVTVGPAYWFEIVAGNGQTATVGAQTPVQPSVRISDRYHNAIPGVTINWTVVGVVGSVTPSVTTSDANGVVSATWTLGAGTNLLRAVVPAPINFTANFSATGVP